MPFLQRVIEPDYVCRNTLPLDEQGVLSVDVPNELECVTNGTLANIIRQLSSLSKHAEDMFSSLFRDSSVVVSRTSTLQGRVDRLAIKVTQLDSNIEEVSLQDIHMRKAFKSYIVYDQQVVARESMPAAMLDTYVLCDKPPPLDKLNPYREDGKDGLKFYTDANYFFDLWKQEMLKDTEKILHDRGKKLVHSKEGAQTALQRLKPDYKKHKKSRQTAVAKEKLNQIGPVKEIEASNYFSIHYGGVLGKGANQLHHDAHPIRPNSLELHSPHFTCQQNTLTESTKPEFSPPPPAYTEHPLSPQHHYPPPPYISSTSEQTPVHNASTPSKNIYRINSLRPSQPPPAPPVSSSSASSSGSSTPTVSGRTSSSSTGRSRTNTHSRDNLPPPPPPPSIPASNTVSVSQTQSTKGLQLNSQSPTYSHELHSPKFTISGQIENSNEEDISLTVKDEASSEDIVDSSVEKYNLPPPPSSPRTEVSQSIQNSNSVTPPLLEIKTVAPLPPPPPPPLPPLDDLIIEGNRNGSISENQNIEAYSITSESASETSSLSKLSENTEVKSKLSAHGGARSDLLAAIREGIKLRRVEDIKQKEVEKAAPLHDVASILARRVAMEFSDSESPSESEYDSDGWEDDKECPKT